MKFFAKIHVMTEHSDADMVNYASITLLQPFGVLQAGTTGYVAEAIGSTLTAYTCQFQPMAGVNLNVNHLHPVPVGSEILVTATPLLLGKCFQVWDIRFETKKPKPPGSDSKIPELVLVANLCYDHPNRRQICSKVGCLLYIWGRNFYEILKHNHQAKRMHAFKIQWYSTELSLLSCSVWTTFSPEQ
ncbi:unnamed protein product [Calypogeia fissa]